MKNIKDQGWENKYINNDWEIFFSPYMFFGNCSKLNNFKYIGWLHM